MPRTHEQTLTIRSGEPLLLETAHGIIRITRVDRRSRQIHVSMPAGLTVSTAQDKLRHDWVQKPVEGEPEKPVHQFYRSVPTEDGGFALVAEEPPKVARITVK